MPQSPPPPKSLPFHNNNKPNPVTIQGECKRHGVGGGEGDGAGEGEGAGGLAADRYCGERGWGCVEQEVGERPAGGVEGGGGGRAEK